MISVRVTPWHLLGEEQGERVEVAGRGDGDVGRGAGRRLELGRCAERRSLPWSMIASRLQSSSASSM